MKNGFLLAGAILMAVSAFMWFLMVTSMDLAHEMIIEMYNDGVLQPEFTPEVIADSIGTLRAFSVFLLIMAIIAAVLGFVNLRLDSKPLAIVLVVLAVVGGGFISIIFYSIAISKTGRKQNN